MRPVDIEKALRAARIEPAAVVAIEEVGDGWECRVFRVERPGVEDVALRLYTGDPSGQTMRAEVAAYLALEKVEYPAPKLLARHDDRQPLGAPFVLIDWLEGPVADSLGTSAAALDMIVDLMVRLHDIVPSGDLLDEGAVPWRSNRNLIEGRFALLDELDLGGFRPSLQWLLERVGDLEKVPLSYVHMDFHPRNVIITGRGPVVFDWGSFAVADPRADLAWSLLLARTYLDDAAAGYFLSYYENRRPEGIEDLVFFEVSAVWRRFATIVTLLRENPPASVKTQVSDGIRLLRPAYQRFVEATGSTIAEVEALYR